MAVEVTVRKWGNSVGALFPKEFVEKEHLELNKRILVEIVKEANLNKLFGSLKRKMSGQKFKDMVREGWKA